MTPAAAGSGNPATTRTGTAVLSEPIRCSQEDHPVSQVLTPSTVRRLAFIRFLYGQGVDQARRPQPLAATALLSFHDAVEMFLLLAAEHLGVSLDRNTTFDGYWTQIATQASVQLPSRSAMRRMNNSRVNFKHHGSIPSATDLDQFRADATTFFTDATQAVFAADFTSIDMTDLVTQQDALAKIRDAETHAGQGDYVEALALLSEALDDLLGDYAARKRISYNTTAFTFGPQRFDTTSAVAHNPEVGSKLGNLILRMTEAVGEMQHALRVLAVGLDYRRYARFDMLVPRIVRFMDGHREVRTVPGLQIGGEEYQFCKLFVIEAAIHLAEMDFDLDLEGLWREHERQSQQAPSAQPGATTS
jgi:hypothetical protein